ncbi:MAG: DNA-3-methyladenine glycosylase 2 family protein [Actinobacteria bacterium]|nr:DNA-3-methyladenine glycosylase 2 family protein [Actinomycetota bacterium]
MVPRSAKSHLRSADPVMAAVIDAIPDARLTNPQDGRPDDHYGTLMRAIVGQQVSTAAARTVYARLCDRFGGGTPTPRQILDDDPEQLRTVGLSRAKTSYLRSLAEHVVSGELELDRLEELDDEAVIAELVAVKGIGVWSAQMFLMFHLKRPDVLPTGDLGIRRAVQIAYSMEELPSPAPLTEIAEPWRPHRTLACRYLWRSLDNEPV